MKIFLDTGNVKEIREAANYGVLDGVTTNPSLVSKEGRDFKDLLVEICNIVDGPISAEVASIRHPQHVVEAALAGGDICTMPFGVFQQLFKHPLTDSGLKKFLADWEARTLPKSP